jgi:hypothetical protein
MALSAGAPAVTAPPPPDLPDFDGVAPFYRWLEYLSLGPMLERVRFSLIEVLPECRSALILGDGDGRFSARLLGARRGVRVEAVDLSARMLALLESRVAAQGDRARVETHRADAMQFTPRTAPDLVVTHFFLDCLEDAEVRTLVMRLTAAVAPDAHWLLSEFCVPEGWLARPAKAYIGLLYLAFRLLTGLRTRRLPDYCAALAQAGWVHVRERRYLFGLLTAQLWRRVG